MFFTPALRIIKLYVIAALSLYVLHEKGERVWKTAEF